MVLKILVLWLLVCFSYSKAEDCSTDTIGLCTPLVTDIITEEKVIEEEKRIHIEEMWVKPELRNKKIGQQYQSKIFKHAKENGYERVSCSVSIHNKYANETLAKFLNNNWKLGWTNGEFIGLIKEVV